MEDPVLGSVNDGKAVVIIIDHPNPLTLVSVLGDGEKGTEALTFSSANDDDESHMMHLIQLVRYVALVKGVPADEVMDELSKEVNTNKLRLKKGPK